MTPRTSKSDRSLLAALAVTVPLSGFGASPAFSADPTALYGQEIIFDVLRDGEKVGFHRTLFRDNGKTLTVDSTFEIEIDFLIFTAFSYAYRSEAEWSGGKLKALRATVIDDGKVSFVEAHYSDDGLRIRTPERSLKAETPLLPTNHWNAAVLQADHVLNTITGDVNRIKITPVGKESVPTERGLVEAMRFSYSGDLETDVWYDQTGRWVKMQFEGRDGSTIEYLCRLCQGPETEAAKK